MSGGWLLLHRLIRRRKQVSDVGSKSTSEQGGRVKPLSPSHLGTGRPLNKSVGHAEGCPCLDCRYDIYQETPPLENQFAVWLERQHSSLEPRQELCSLVAKFVKECVAPDQLFSYIHREHCLPLMSCGHPKRYEAFSVPGVNRCLACENEVLRNVADVNTALENVRVAVKRSREICARCGKHKSDDRHTPCDEMCPPFCGCHAYEDSAAPLQPPDIGSESLRWAYLGDAYREWAGRPDALLPFLLPQKFALRLLTHKLEAEKQAHQLREERDAWKGAIIDACVVDWIFTKEHETNPHKAVNDLLSWQSKVALDPRVSKPAHDLAERAQAAEAERDKLRTELIYVAARLMRGEFVLSLDNVPHLKLAKGRAETQRKQHADEARRIDKVVKELDRLRKEAKKSD